MYTSYNEACGRDCSDLMTDLELCEKAGMDYKMCIRDRERTWDFKEQEIRWIEKKGAAHRITDSAENMHILLDRRKKRRVAKRPLMLYLRSFYWQQSVSLFFRHIS